MQALNDMRTTLSNQHIVFAVALYGSQNYELDTPSSDIDAKAFILPSFSDLALKQKWLSETLEFPTGICDIKDIRAMFENYLKSNINFLETLYTNFTSVNPTYAAFWNELISLRDIISNAYPHRMLHAAAGMAAQKFQALEKPFESKTDVLAKYGYDPKQLCHLARLRFFMYRYIDTNDFAACLVPSSIEKEFLFQFKYGELTLNQARRKADFMMSDINALIHIVNVRYIKNPESEALARELLDQFTLRLLRFHFAQESLNLP